MSSIPSVHHSSHAHASSSAKGGSARPAGHAAQGQDFKQALLGAVNGQGAAPAASTASSAGATAVPPSA